MVTSPSIWELISAFLFLFFGLLFGGVRKVVKLKLMINQDGKNKYLKMINWWEHGQFATQIVGVYKLPGTSLLFTVKYVCICKATYMFIVAA